MQFETHGEFLARAATSANGACSPQQVRILLSVQDGEARITGSDGAYQIGVGLIAHAAEPGSCAVAGDDLVQISRALPKEADVRVRLEGQALTITSGRFTSSIPTLDATGFPGVVVDALEAQAVDIAPGLLSQALDAVVGAVGVDVVQMPSLQGINLAVRDGALRVTASDGRRLSLVRIEALPNLPEAGITLPMKAVKDISRIGQKRSIRLSSDGQRVYAAAGSEHVLSALIDTEYPDVTGLFALPARSIRVPRAALLAAALRVRAVLDRQDRTPILTLGVQNADMSVSAQVEHKQAREQVQVMGDAVFSLGVNAQFLADALRCFTSADITLYNDDPAQKILLADPEANDGTLAIIMPARI